MRRCHACGSDIPPAEKVRRSDECPGCGRDVHCCMNCRHYHPGAHNQCLEPVAEWVSDKERSNFCDYFSFSDAATPASKQTGEAAAEKAREKWSRLFKS